MKRLIAVMLMSAMLMLGCGGEGIVFSTPELPADLCTEFNAEESFILKQSVELNMPLKDIYYGLLDATTIAMIMEAVDKEQVRDFMLDLEEFYNKNYPFSYLTLIDYMIEGEKATQIAQLLSRRIQGFRSPQLISEFDNCLLKSGWKGVWNELYL